jgi:hypothetical protein
MTFTDAAAEVLRLIGRPLHYKEITQIAIEKNLLSHVGKSPEVAMGARLAALMKKADGENPLVRTAAGVFGLRSWDDKTLRGEGGRRRRRGKADEAAATEELAASAPEVDADASAPAEDEPLPPDEDALSEAEAQASAAADAEASDASEADGATAEPVDARTLVDEELPPAGPDDRMRADAASHASELFDEEDDDDQPLLGGDDRPAEGAEGDGRRRRRRRRRGRGDDRGPSGEARPDASSRGGEGREGREGRGPLPSYTATPIEGAAPRAQVIDLGGDSGAPLDDMAGRELGDALVVLLGGFDRNGGPVSLRQLAEAAQRRGRLQGEPQLLQSQVAAAIRADGARRAAQGQRPRFRFSAGRVSLVEWSMPNDLVRLEQEALVAVERYRDAARRALGRKLAELPGHAFVEVVLLLAERMGLGQIRSLRRPGAGGVEAHFSGVLRNASEEARVAVVVRRDGRELGRERIAELRGSLHHYGPAVMGWLFTSGQVLSGAREEASIVGPGPVSVFDGAGVARLCEEHEVAVVRSRLPIALPDLDLLDALRAS